MADVAMDHNNLPPAPDDASVSLVQDVESLHTNSVTLAAAAGAYLASPTKSNTSGLINAATAEAINVAAIGKDIAAAIQRVAGSGCGV